MLLKGMVLASMGFYQGELGTMLSKLDQMGFFSYLLPFLLIFAIIFGILTRIGLFTNKKDGAPNNGINAIIALVVALMALQFSFVSEFFAEIFPRLGVGLAILLVALILLGLFAPHNQDWMNYVWLGIAATVLIFVLVKSGFAFGNTLGYWFSENWFWLVVIVVFLIIIATIVGSANPNKSKKSDTVLSELLKKSTE